MLQFFAIAKHECFGVLKHVINQVNSFFFHQVDVVKEAGVTMDPFVVTVFIGLTRLLFTVIAGWTSRHFGRRPCSLISGSGMTVSLLVLAGHLYFKVNQSEGLYDMDVPTTTVNYSSTIAFMNSTVMRLVNGSDLVPVNNLTTSGLLAGPSDKSLVPVISILIYILTSTIGFLTLPWSMLGEVFPTKIRGVNFAIINLFLYIYFYSFTCFISYIKNSK